MVEKVKTAMLATGLDVVMWADEPLTELARAAIHAMRKPTPKVTEAGADAAMAYTVYSKSAKHCADGVWRDMIDEALR